MRKTGPRIRGIGPSRCDSHAELPAGAFVNNDQDAVKARNKYFGVSRGRQVCPALSKLASTYVETCPLAIGVGYAQGEANGRRGSM